MGQGVRLGADVQVGGYVALGRGEAVGVGGATMGWGKVIKVGPGAGADGRYAGERITMSAIAPRMTMSASVRAATVSHCFRDTVVLLRSLSLLALDLYPNLVIRLYQHSPPFYRLQRQRFVIENVEFSIAYLLRFLN